ncbi:MAG: TonB family protein [Methylomonas sp.]|nr:TonB family protein [Methylomonas sp.]
MIISSTNIDVREQYSIFDASSPRLDVKQRRDEAEVARSGRYGSAMSAAIVAGALHAGAIVWLSNLPASEPRSAAVPLPMIALELASPPSPRAPAAAPPMPKSPDVPVKREVAKQAIKPKPKRPMPKPLAEKAQPIEKTHIPEEVQPAPVQPLVQNHDAPSSPVSETYVPPKTGMAYMNNPKPVYPMEARRQHLEGLVVLKVFVSAEGMAERVRIERSSGHDVLDDSALSAVREWRFVPAKRGHLPEAGWATVPINFSLG